MKKFFGIKKAAAIMLAFFMIVNVLIIAMPEDGTGSLFLTAYAAETVASGTCGDNLTWVLDKDDILTISGTGAMDDCSAVSASLPWNRYTGRIKKVVIEIGVTSIGEYAFSNCGAISEVLIADTVTSIGAYAFVYCDSLTRINIPNGITCISESMFYNCSSLKEIYLPESITTISSYAFTKCDSLKEIELPRNLTTISSYAFHDCASLLEINIPLNVSTIGVNAFSRCPLLTGINVSVDNLSYTSIDGVLFDKNATRLIACPSSKSGIYIIPDNVKSIENEAFRYCSLLTEVIIPYGVENIGSSSFRECTGLTRVVIPDSVTELGHSAFRSCRQLIDITISCNITTISNWAFQGCSSLWHINIPEGVRSTMPSSFAYCTSLSSISLPKSLKRVYGTSFPDCTSLSDVYYAGSEEEWNKITIQDDEYLTNATIHFNWSGEVPEETYPQTIKICDFNDLNYSFENYVDHFSLEDYQYVYGDNQGTEEFYKSEAGLFGVWSFGVCFGMSATSLIMNTDVNITPASFKNTFGETVASRVYDIKKHYYSAAADFLSAKEFIAAMHISQSSGYLQSIEDSNLQNLFYYLNSKNLILIGVRSNGKGHAIVPYRMELIDEYTAHIYVYDCNHPEDESLYITISKSNISGEWSNDYLEWSYLDYGSDKSNSSISYFPVGNLVYTWNSLAKYKGESNPITSEIVEQTFIVDGNADIYSLNGGVASIRNGVLIENSIDGLNEVLFFRSEIDNEPSKKVVIYAPNDVYTFESIDDDSFDVTVCDMHSSISTKVLSGSKAKINVSDLKNNSIEVIFSEKTAASEVAFYYGYDDTADKFIDDIFISGNMSSDRFSAEMTDDGLLVEGLDSLSADAQKNDQKVETTKVNTNNGITSSVLITLGEDNIISFDEDVDGDGSYETNLFEGETKTVATDVEITSGDIELSIGESIELRTELFPVNHTDNPEIHWLSEDESVVTVSETGVITAVGVGTTEVHCSTGPLITDSIYVTVTEQILLNANEIYIKPNETYAIGITHLPEDAVGEVTYSSSNNSVASVDENGTITAHALGTAIITATVGEVSASCTVEVVPPISLTAMGGSVRIVEPYGLRFGIQLKKDEAYNEYKDIIVSYGTLIIPKKNLGDVPLTFDVEKAMDVPAVNIYSEDDTQRTYTGVLVGIPKSAFYSDIVGRGYLKYLDIDGNEKVMYTDEIVRSYYQVANSAYTRYGAMTDRDATEQAVYEKLAALLSEMTDGDNITNY